MASESADQNHYETYYVPEQSKFPIFASMGLFLTVFGLAHVLNDIKAGVDPSNSSWIAWGGFFLLSCVLYNWFATVIRENHEGLPSEQLKRSYVWAMAWFIFSEVMFFAAFFGALYYVRNLAVPWLAGEGDKGMTGALLWQEFSAIWPVVNNPDSNVFPDPGESMGWGGLPLINTIILLSSSVTVHIAHSALKAGQRKKLIGWLAFTVLLGVIFLILQAEEYHHAYTEMGLTLNSGIYGSTFFLLTGFHGFHVCLGTFMLFVMLMRSIKGHFTLEDHFGFEAASWYWHFVDVVWVCLFLFVYIL